MRVVFFGLGPIGTRHATILQQMGGMTLCAFRSDPRKPKNSLNIPEIFSWETLEAWKPDVAFITNPTFRHMECALACVERGWRLFVEKPIHVSTEGLARLTHLLAKHRVPSYVAYVLRFHPAIQHLYAQRYNVHPRRVSVICTSYLPYWRKNSDSHMFYSAYRDQGGGAILDVSHEFDYIDYLFGPIKNISGQFGRRGAVTVDAEDYVEAILECPRLAVNLYIDVCSQQQQRSITIETSSGIETTDLLQYPLDAAYHRQIQYFLNNIDNPDMMNNVIEARPLFEKLIAFRERDIS